MEENYYLTLILKYLEGGITPEGKKELEDWIVQDYKNKRLFEKIKLNWWSNLPENPTYNFESAFENVSLKLALPTTTTVLNNENPAKEKRYLDYAYRQWSRIAAVLVGILLISGIAYHLFFINTTVTHSTDYGQTYTISLPDNSVVTLYANSSITYSDDWDDEKYREVSLEGEAFFNVTKDKNRAFLVNTTGIAIKVLGTSFNVKSYKDDEHIETTLVEGKVEISKIRNEKDKIILVPNQKALFSKETEDLILAQVDTDEYEPLINEKLIFKNERISEVVKAISKKFEVNIKTGNRNINNCTVTANFTDQPLSVTLDLLCTLIDTQYIINGKQITLKGKGCEN